MTSAFSSLGSLSTMRIAEVWFCEFMNKPSFVAVPKVLPNQPGGKNAINVPTHE